MKAHMWITLILLISMLSIPVFGEDVAKVYGSVPKNGVNQVTLDNSANNKEAVVVFKEINWPIPFAVILGPQQTGVLHLPSDSYQVYFTLGYGWNTGQNRFNTQPEYYMIAGVFNAGEAGTIHEEKTRPQNVITGTYFDPVDNMTKVLTEGTDPAEWAWAESVLPLYITSGSGHVIVPIQEADFPL